MMPGLSMLTYGRVTISYIGLGQGCTTPNGWNKGQIRDKKEEDIRNV